MYVIIVWIKIHFGGNPRNGGSSPKDNSDVNIMNFISVACCYGFVKDDAPYSLMTDTTISDKHSG